MDWKRYDPCATLTSTGVSDADIIDSCIAFGDIGIHSRLVGDNSDALILRVNDDLTGVGIEEFRIQAQGKFDPIGGIS